jgi:hypothetical protein
MSNPRLPAEILDHIVDHLHNAEDELISCCLVSKSWIPRTRKHIFANVEFRNGERLRSWKERFLDPSTSPSCYTRTLTINCLQVVTAVDAEEGGWIGGFSHIEHLRVHGPTASTSGSPLAPFHGFSPAIKSLRVAVPALPPSQIFNLTLSFPLLEDLAVIIYLVMSADNGDGSAEDEMLTAAQPSAPPRFTGSLELYLLGGMKPFTRRLLSLPSGVHFRKLTLTWNHDEDISTTMALVEGCSHTLESLDIKWNLGGSIRNLVRTNDLLQVLFPGKPRASINLSKVTKLKAVVFRLELGVDWIIRTLQTITSEHREHRQTSIHMPHHRISFPKAWRAYGEANHEEYLSLDRLLVQFWESRSIRPEVIFPKGQDMRGFIERLLPEITKGGIIDLVEN